MTTKISKWLWCELVVCDSTFLH